MERPETYTATLEVIFDVWKDENPRAIAKKMADHFNGSKGGNCYSDGVLKKLARYKEKATD